VIIELWVPANPTSSSRLMGFDQLMSQLSSSAKGDCGGSSNR
jgi:hypothetical protein